MSQLKSLMRNIKKGKVYRRADLIKWSNAVDRHIAELLEEGTLEKLAQGIYYAPKETVFGIAPPDDDLLIRTFLKDDDFLVTSPNNYNSLDLGTTQLYNEKVIYNHKRHGEFEIGGRNFTFRRKNKFPAKLSMEFLLVDLVSNLDSIAEDHDKVLKNIAKKVQTMDKNKLERYVSNYGTVRAKKIFKEILQTTQ